MLSSNRLTGTLVALVGLVGCASGFSKISPGMTSHQVNELVGHGPSRARQFQDGSVAWFYGADQCIRIQDDAVVAKEVTESVKAVQSPWFSVSEQRVAQCAPAGEEVDSNQVNIYTPIGVISTPARNLDPKKQNQSGER